jgi:hypothetical protein
MTQKPNLLTEARKALVRQLESVTPANDFRTSAGLNVRSGWFSEIIETVKSGFPMIVIQRNDAKPPEAAPAAMKVFPGFHVIGAVDAGLEAYEDALDDLEEDLVRCLAPSHGTAAPWLPQGVPGITQGAPRRFPPGNGNKTATVVIPIYLTTFIDTITYR